jgi:hypothetical protein
MSEAQVITIAVSLGVSFIAVPTGVLLNNNRLNDVKQVLDTRISDVKEVLRAEARADKTELILLMEKNHSEILAKLGEIDSRLSRLEAERRVISWAFPLLPRLSSMVRE